MYNFFVAFMGVFYAGQATAIVFMFSSSTKPQDDRSYRIFHN